MAGGRWQRGRERQRRSFRASCASQPHSPTGRPPSDAVTLVCTVGTSAPVERVSAAGSTPAAGRSEASNPDPFALHTGGVGIASKYAPPYSEAAPGPTQPLSTLCWLSHIARALTPSGRTHNHPFCSRVDGSPMAPRGSTLTLTVTLTLTLTLTLAPALTHSHPTSPRDPTRPYLPASDSLCLIAIVANRNPGSGLLSSSFVPAFVAVLRPHRRFLLSPIFQRTPSRASATTRVIPASITPRRPQRLHTSSTLLTHESSFPTAVSCAHLRQSSLSRTIVPSFSTTSCSVPRLLATNTSHFHLRPPASDSLSRITDHIVGPHLASRIRASLPACPTRPHHKRQRRPPHPTAVPRCAAHMPQSVPIPSTSAARSKRALVVAPRTSDAQQVRQLPSTPARLCPPTMYTAKLTDALCFLPRSQLAVQGRRSRLFPHPHRRLLWLRSRPAPRF